MDNRALKLIGQLSPNVIALLKSTMIDWKTELISGDTNLAGVNINRGIFQGDSLSLLLFILSLIPLTLVLRPRLNHYFDCATIMKKCSFFISLRRSLLKYLLTWSYIAHYITNLSKKFPKGILPGKNMCNLKNFLPQEFQCSLTWFTSLLWLYLAQKYKVIQVINLLSF